MGFVVSTPGRSKAASAMDATAAGVSSVGGVRRESRAGTVASLMVALLALSGCFPCEGIAVAFPDHPVIVQGAWVGAATSSFHPTIDLSLVLEVEYVSTRSYAVTGILERDGATQLEVLGEVNGFCEQRFEPSATVFPSTPAPEAPRFEATLFPASGARAGSILVYRLVGAGSDHDTMHGELRLDDAGTSHFYSIELERL